MVALPPKDLETLLVLVERAGNIVSKEELLEKVWPGVFIEEGNLSRRIFNLRQALGDKPDGRKYIETVPRRGYRFVAPVQEDGGPPVLPRLAQAPSEQPQLAVLPSHKKRMWFSLAVVTVVAVAAILIGQYFRLERNRAPQRAMLAVLPFENLSGDPHDEYLADGLTEEMIAQLGELQPAKLGVI